MFHLLVRGHVFVSHTIVIIITLVVVVTTGNGVIKRGVTCSSFTSVSSIPPIISFCMKKPRYYYIIIIYMRIYDLIFSRMHQLLLDTKRFAVHVLSEKQVHISRLFIYTR